MKKTIFITGASKGIGLEISKQLQQAGHTVIGTSRKPDEVNEISFPLLTLDVQDDAAVKTAVSQAIAQLGHIDVLINNAGYDLYAAAEEAGVDETVAQMNVNFFGAVRLITAVLPHMRQQGSGHIINISSIGGNLGLPYNSAYAASKFALEGYSESLRLELRPVGIDVSLIAPEAVSTNTLDTSIRGATNKHPVYATQSEKMIAAMRDMGRNSRITPAKVAQVVKTAVNAKHPKLRYPVGIQAQWVPILKQLLPQSVFERFMLQQFA